MRTLARPFLLTVALLFLFVLPSAARTPVERNARTESPIENFAMDGATVAYSTDTPGLRIFAWNVLTGHKTRLSGIRTQDQSQAIAGLAIAGQRVAWISANAGNTEYVDSLYTASLPRPKERLLAASQRFASGDCPGDPRCTDGTWIHGLVGSGNLVAVSRWTTGVKAGVESVSNERLETIGSRGLRTLVSGPGTIVAQSSDSGRIAVLRPVGIIDESQRYSGASINIYNARGQLLRYLRLAARDLARGGQGRMAEVVLSGDYLAVLTVQPRLKLYNWRHRKLLHSWRLPSGAGHLDIYRQLATYLVTRSNTGLTVHVRHLRTGRDVIFRDHLSDPPPTSGFVGVGIEKPGLAYAWNGCSGEDCYGVLRFVPMAHVLAAVSKGM